MSIKMKNKSFKTQFAKLQTGSVLLEALIAILIFSFGILAISGLQAAMVKNTSEANYRAVASYIAQQKIGQMWADPDAVATFVGNQDISDRLPKGNLQVVGVAFNRFDVLVSWQAPGEPAHTFSTSANIDFNKP
jgi:type IV pilus assembly protein PilV